MNAMPTPKPMPDACEIIAALELESHVEGGYYRRTYQSAADRMIDGDRGSRHLMTSIYYLLTAASPTGYFHRNRSDILHYHHLGNALRYFLISPDGTLETVTMGSDIRAGQRLQLHVPGGVWKASMLLEGPSDYGLISEAVSPGFDFADMELGNGRELARRFPEHAALVEKMTRVTGT
jgi:predicted cupin superfamily sugar epimerase